MNAKKLKELLRDHEPQKVDIFINYCLFLESEIDKKTKEKKNKWMYYKKDNDLANYYNIVINDGLEFDGKHVTLQSTGISYDFIAYKNKMMLVYPETIFDVQLVRKGDIYQFEKNSGLVAYKHEIKDPFGNKPILGGYAVIKNSRGEFFTSLSHADFEKHRKVAKTDNIWSQWYEEMCMKTLVKKACKIHFEDMFRAIEEQDNKQNDLEKPLEIPIEMKQDIEKIETKDDLNKYYKDNRDKDPGLKAAFHLAITQRLKEIKEQEKIVEDSGNETH